MGSQDHETGRVRSGDAEIFYRRFGRPGRTPVLIAHGLSYFSYDWIGPAAGIAVDREVVAIDMRGFANLPGVRAATISSKRSAPTSSRCSITSAGLERC